MDSSKKHVHMPLSSFGHSDAFQDAFFALRCKSFGVVEEMTLRLHSLSNQLDPLSIAQLCKRVWHISGDSGGAEKEELIVFLLRRINRSRVFERLRMTSYIVRTSPAIE